MWRLMPAPTEQSCHSTHEPVETAEPAQQGVYRLLRGWEQVLEWLTKGAGGVGRILILGMMFLTTADVLRRWLFNRPISGTLEISEFMLVVFAALGMAFAQASGANVRVSISDRLFPPRIQALLHITGHVLALMIMLLLVRETWRMGLDEIRFGTVSDALKIPVYPFKFLLAGGAAILCLQLLRSIVAALEGLLKR